MRAFKRSNLYDTLCNILVSFQSMMGVSGTCGSDMWEYGGAVELDRRPAGGRDQSQHPSSASSSSDWGAQLGINVNESCLLLSIVVVGIGVSDRR